MSNRLLTMMINLQETRRDENKSADSETPQGAWLRLTKISRAKGHCLRALVTLSKVAIKVFCESLNTRRRLIESRKLSRKCFIIYATIFIICAKSSGFKFNKH